MFTDILILIFHGKKLSESRKIFFLNDFVFFVVIVATKFYKTKIPSLLV